MQKYNPEIHKRRSVRLKNYDYSQEGLYFVTICCQDKEHFFGKIENGKMILNPIGKIVKQCWEEIPKHFPNVALHSFVIMPNHFQGIIEITANVGAKNLSPNINNDFQTENMANWDRAKSISPLRSPSKTLGSIVRGFKIGVTKWVRNNTPTFIKSGNAITTNTLSATNNRILKLQNI